MTIRIRRFDPSTIKPHRITFLIGKRHTGKSSLMIDLLRHIPNPDFVLAFSPTDDTLQVFKHFIPECCMFSSFSHELLEKILSMQRTLIRRQKSRSVLILMDDCLYQKGVLKSEAMRDLFYNGRHLHVSLICACQYLMDIGPEVRTNIDYLFTMRESTISNRSKLWKYFFGQFARFDQFDKVMAACTQNYSALVMDATKPSTRSSDTIFWFRAVLDPPNFKLGNAALWKQSSKVVCDQNREPEESASGIVLVQ